MGWNYIGVTKSIQPGQTKTTFYLKQQNLDPVTINISRGRHKRCWCVSVEGWWPGGGITIIWASYEIIPSGHNTNIVIAPALISWHNIVPSWSPPAHVSVSYSLSCSIINAASYEKDKKKVEGWFLFFILSQSYKVTKHIEKQTQNFAETQTQ